MSRLAIIVLDTPDKRDPPEKPHKHFGLENFGVRTDDIESVVKRAGTEGTTIIQDVAQARPGHKFAFIMAPENMMIKVSEA